MSVRQNILPEIHFSPRSSAYGFCDIWVAAARLRGSEEYVNDPPLFLLVLRHSLFLSFFSWCLCAFLEAHTHSHTHYEAGAGSVHRCDCSPSGFKSSRYSPRATVLLQMLIVFSFSLSPGCLSFPLSLAVYTINLVHSLSHTHSRCLARRERLEGGIWTYLTEGHPSLSSPASPPPTHTHHHHQKPHGVVFCILLV